MKSIECKTNKHNYLLDDKIKRLWYYEYLYHCTKCGNTFTKIINKVEV